MYVLNGIVLIIAGFGAMGFGLFLFYALLPLFYAFFGAGVGYWLGSFFTSTPPGEMSLIKFIFVIGGGIAFASSAYFLEPFRRILIGVGLGSLVAGLIASALGLTGMLGSIIMFVGAVLGAGITLAVFDRFIIVASAVGGAGLVMDGVFLVFRSLDIVDRTSIADGAIAPVVIWAVLGALALTWQFTNIERWTRNTYRATDQ
ncbi:MAG: hypothetical protein ACR2QV_10700 [Gammaproteobacteria bacterium]